MLRSLQVACVAALVGSCSAPVPTGGAVAVDAAKDAFSAGGEAALKAKLRASDEPVSVLVRLVDSYGRKSEAPVVTMSWAKADLEKIVWSEMSPARLANIASVQVDGRYGIIAFAEWCDDYRNLTPMLCGPERARAEEAWISRSA